MKFNQGRWTFWFMAGLIFFIPDITIAAQAATPEIKKAVIMNTPLKAQLSLEQAQKTMTTRIYKGKIGQRALYANPKLKPAGAKIGSWKIPSKLVVSKPSWFFFVDEQPGANWEHKASYILVDKASGEVTRVPAMSPPREALTLKPLNKKAKT
ncbi:MAG: hypothetical protein HUK40_08995 [Desulfobacter sp.]|nr:hypothetical protein [Desulfobacter sp.]WDP84638.1 MAG: hypothetical protein HUN05_05325 [Desulfobacter sp.]